MRMQPIKLAIPVLVMPYGSVCSSISSSSVLRMYGEQAISATPENEITIVILVQLLRVSPIISQAQIEAQKGTVALIVY